MHADCDDDRVDRIGEPRATDSAQCHLLHDLSSGDHPGLLGDLRQR